MHQGQPAILDREQLFVLGLERPDIEEAVLRELVHRDVPLAIGLERLAHRGGVVAGLIVHVLLVEDRVHVLAIVGADRVLDVPLDHLAVEKERGKGVALAVIAGVKRPQPQFGLGHHGRTRIDAVILEEGIEFRDIENRNRRRQLAVDADMLLVRGGVDAVRAVGDGHVAGVFLVLALAPVEHLDAVHLGKVASGDTGLDLGEVEDHDMIHLARGHFGQVHAHFRVVRGRKGVFALVIAIGVVEVPRHHHLPGDFHRVAVERGEEVDVLFGLVQHRPVIDHRHLVLAIGKDIAGARELLRAQAVDRFGVGDLDDLVAFHDVAAHPRDAGVGLVVHEDEAPVIGALGERHVRVVQIAVVVDALAVGVEERLGFGQHPVLEYLQAFVGLPPAGGRTAVEHRNAHEFAHRGHAENAQLAGLARGPDAVVFVELARREAGSVGCGPCGGGARGGGGNARGAAHQRQPRTARAAQKGRAAGGRAQHCTAAEAGFRCLVRHLSSPFGWGDW